ncbi:MAG: methyltransferase type 12 [Pseudonocardiales bacterium]|nr:methyltransferase type 12 [Pseudonocardiales bacterium]
MDDPIPPAVDDKDWTWVLEVPCPECGYDARTLDRAELAGQITATGEEFAQALTRPDAERRPAAQTWSVLEYGCHVRDVFGIFGGRAELMLKDDDPLFANWDQDETALESRYWEQEPTVVTEQLLENAAYAAGVFARVEPDQWARTGRRSNGSVFTVESLGKYFVHDLVHHAWDIRVG